MRRTGPPGEHGCRRAGGARRDRPFGGSGACRCGPRVAFSSSEARRSWRCSPSPSSWGSRGSTRPTPSNTPLPVGRGVAGQSSNDLTRMARSYVFAGDPGSNALYWVTLAIRSGEAPRPPRCACLDWDTAIRAAARRSRDGVAPSGRACRGSRSALPVCCGPGASLGASLLRSCEMGVRAGRRERCDHEGAACAPGRSSRMTPS